MSRMRHILAATDLSAPARRAAMRAGMLAVETGARLTLAHVVNLSLTESLRQLVGQAGETIERRLANEAIGELDRLAADIGKRYGVTGDVHVATGAVVQEIASHADRLDAGLLVLGARGAGFAPELLLGTTTERVLPKTIRPLLVVKQMPHETYRRVLVPVDFSARSAASLSLARAIAPEADLVLLNAFEVPFERKLHYAGIDDLEMIELREATKRHAMDRMDELVARAGLSDDAVQPLVLYGQATNRILEQEQENDCDLIVIGKHGYGMVEELLMGSVTKHVLALSSGDVLVANRDVV